jgi:hypothetical protein
MSTHRPTVVGVFESRREAQAAVEELKRAGFRDEQIGVASRDEEHAETQREPGHEEGSYAGEGAVSGAIAGAGVGGLWALGIAAGFLPAIGPIIAGGILASVLASAAAGAAVGGVAGALIGLGIPEDEAEYYETEFKTGRILVTVKADGRTAEATEILRRFGAYDAANRFAIAAHERHSGLAGHTEHKTVEVPVRRDEAAVERDPMTGRKTSMSEIREGEEIRVPVREEEVRVERVRNADVEKK